MTEYTPDTIATVSNAIADFHAEWDINRAFVAGARKVRAGGEKYLPRFPSVDIKHHQAIVDRTPFFPGASRTHKGIIGLMFRKPPEIKGSDAFKKLLQTITHDGGTIDDLYEAITDELLTVNFGIALVDYPETTQRYTKAQAEILGVRARSYVYPAENILGIDRDIVNNRQQPVNIRIQQSINTIRELVLIDGVYTIRIWQRADGAGSYAITAVSTPKIKGKTLGEIPATVINLGRKYDPSPAPLSDVCDLNKSHYYAASNLAGCDYWMSNPTPWTTGTKPRENVSISPGTIWQFEEEGARVGMLEYSGSQAAQLESRTETFRDYMAAAGAQILAPEKAVAESGQALEIRNAAQTATLDAIVRAVNRIITDQLKWIARWEDEDENAVGFEASGEFISAKMSPEERKQLMAEWQAGVISLETYVGELIAGNVLSEDYDFEADQDRIAMEAADRPPVDTFPVATGSEDAPTV